MGKRSYVNEHEVGVPAVLRRARLHLLSQGTHPTDAVGCGSIVLVRCREASNDLVQEVVDEIHLGASISLRPVDIAVEGSVSDVVRRLPHVGEL